MNLFLSPFSILCTPNDSRQAVLFLLLQIAFLLYINMSDDKLREGACPLLNIIITCYTCLWSCRSLDLHYSHDIERNQAIRLCRHLMELDASSLKASIVLPFIAIAGDGAATSDRMVLTALEFLCELGKNLQLLPVTQTFHLLSSSDACMQV